MGSVPFSRARGATAVPLGFFIVLENTLVSKAPQTPRRWLVQKRMSQRRQSRDGVEGITSTAHPCLHRVGADSITEARASREWRLMPQGEECSPEQSCGQG